MLGVHSPDLAVGGSSEKVGRREKFSKTSSPAHLLERGTVELDSENLYLVQPAHKKQQKWPSTAQQKHQGVDYGKTDGRAQKKSTKKNSPATAQRLQKKNRE